MGNRRGWKGTRATPTYQCLLLCLKRQASLANDSKTAGLTLLIKATICGEATLQVTQSRAIIHAEHLVSKDSVEELHDVAEVTAGTGECRRWRGGGRAFVKRG